MARREKGFAIRDDNGRTYFKVFDRITPDDLVVHLIERELFRLAGGEDPGVELNSEFIDFLVIEKYLSEGT